MNIEKRLESLKKDELAKYGAMMFIATILSGAISYVYQVYMGRILGPEEYGIFGALFGIFYMIEVISYTLAASATQFTARFIGEGKQIGFFIKRALKQVTIIGLVVSIIFLIFTDGLMSLFKLKNSGPILVLIFILFISWVAPIISGILRGLKQFPALCYSSISNAIFKLIFGVLLVILGMGITGAMLGLAMGMAFGILIGFIYIKPYIRPNNPHDPEFNFRSFYMYSFPVMVAMFSYSVPANLDVILAKYFFTDIDAGFYTSVSVLGKIMFFLSASICGVMFPMVAEKYAKKENTIGVFKKSILFVTVVSGIITLVYILFPEILVKVFGQRYVGAIPLMVPYSLAMFFFSITTTTMYYHLAIKNLKYIVILTGFTLLEIYLFLMFHSSVLEMVDILLGTNLILMITSILYTWFHCSNVKLPYST